MKKIPRIITILLLLTAASAARAQLANVWHIPGNTENGVPSTMRDPLNPQPNASVTIYQGVWKGNGANQIGGLLHYRINSGAWQQVGLTFHSNVNANTSSHNQFWKATITMPNNAGAFIEYYLAPTFDNRTSPTYLFNNNQVTANQTAAQASPYTFNVSFPTPNLTVNGVNANYSKSNFYIDEVRDATFPEIEVLFTPNSANLTDVEVFTNLNNRDRAVLDYNLDGIEDGIIPPNGANITAADVNAYYRAYPMQNLGNGTYRLVLPVNKTGAYRLTARYKVQGNPNWIWVGQSGYRDHAIIVAPKSARDMRVYELHVTNVNASGPTFAQRGTFEALHNPASRVNLTWLHNLGINWIWFQPFHPQGIEGRQNDPDTGQPFDPGSPYSIRNFWEINPLYTANYNGSLSNPVSHPQNYAAAMTAFQNFAQAADQQGIQLMLDFPFNHTSPDVVLGQKGVEIFGGPGNPNNWQPGDEIRNRVPQFFSTDGGEGPAAYSAPANSAARIAVAPDRDDFGKWSDVRDVFFGRYATLVTGYPGADSSRATVRNEADWFDYSSLGNVTIGVWRYFGAVLPYWIVQSGHRGFNSTPADGNDTIREQFDNQGIDGLRKDFGQGLPPQCMEYIINRTHSVKWNFVFMTESLDGGEVTYRSSRHFAVLNENIVFPLQTATNTSAHRGVLDDRRNAYGTSLVLLNNTSHDEEPYADPWQALIRYAVVSTNDGAPMIMYGQEIGAGQKFQNSVPQGSFDFYELNFGKNIPHFKKWNSMQPQWNAWDANSLGTKFLFPVYSGIGQARSSSAALPSIHRWFLNRKSDGQPNQQIFAVAKYTTPNASAAVQESLFAFVNLNRNSDVADTFGVPNTLADLMGIKTGRTYNVKNLAAYTGLSNELSNRRQTWLWGAGLTRSNIVNDGVYAALNKIPTNNATWSSAPYEAQYLRIYDVTQLPAPPSSPTSANYALDGSVTFSWAPVIDPEGLIPLYELTVTRSDSQVMVFQTTQTSYTVTGIPIGISATGTVRTLNPNKTDVTSPATPSSPQTLSIASNADNDGDGMSNGDEHIAGTNPLDASSVFRITSITSNSSGVTIQWQTSPGKTYRVDATSSLSPPSWTPLATGLTSGSYHDPSPTGSRKFYRVVVQP